MDVLTFFLSSVAAPIFVVYAIRFIDKKTEKNNR